MEQDVQFVEINGTNFGITKCRLSICIMEEVVGGDAVFMGGTVVPGGSVAVADMLTMGVDIAYKYPTIPKFFPQRTELLLYSTVIFAIALKIQLVSVLSTISLVYGNILSLFQPFMSLSKPG